MEDWYSGEDAPMRFLVMVRASDGGICKTDTCSDTQVSICSRERVKSVESLALTL